MVASRVTNTLLPLFVCKLMRVKGGPQKNFSSTVPGGPQGRCLCSASAILTLCLQGNLDSDSHRSKGTRWISIWFLKEKRDLRQNQYATPLQEFIFTILSKGSFPLFLVKCGSWLITMIVFHLNIRNGLRPENAGCACPHNRAFYKGS